IIQFGAILSVVILYWKRFFRLNRTPAPEGASFVRRLLHKYDFYWKLLVAFIPAAVLGLLCSDAIDAMLESVTVVAVMLIVGGVFMLFCDRIFNKGSEQTELTEKRAFLIGLFQCISMIPGVSRSMATIVGGMAQRLTRKAAAEFSFFLAVPTMFAATVYKLAKLFMEGGTEILRENLAALIVGNVVAFIVALLAIKFFIAFVTKYGFKAFGWYRIIVGAVILILLLSGHELTL
ncbi:MAG TPA: UDP-diphosphatase, partial [Bacteroides sp.]|nr:UDP-diphosphatase [Bacteroides sp.]